MITRQAGSQSNPEWKCKISKGRPKTTFPRHLDLWISFFFWLDFKVFSVIMEKSDLIELKNMVGYQGTNVETGNQNTIPKSEEGEHVFEEEDTTNNTPLVRNPKFWSGIVLVFVSLIAMMTLVSPRNGAKGMNKNASELTSDAQVHNYLVNYGMLDTAYCKTKCEDACAVYPSQYGPLCCEWSAGPDGGKSKICAQSIQGDGTCVCGGGSDASPPYDVAPKPAPTEKTGKPSPAKSSKSGSKKNDDFWDDKAWSDDFWKGGNGGDKGSGGGGGWGWKPIEPIKVPENSTPCKRKCDNACGYSNSKCCEPSPSGNHTHILSTHIH